MTTSVLGAVPTSTEWWPIVPPLLAGGAAIYLLLPRPRSYPVLWGSLLGLLALILAGVLLARSGAVTPETVLFWAFSALGIVSGTLLVTQHNPARAALSFTLVVLSTCGLYLLLAAPFLMAATIIIYAGAIIVTFLFVIMLAQQVGLSDADDRSREPLLATITGFVLLGTLLFVLERYDERVSEERGEIDRLIERTHSIAKLDKGPEIFDRVGKPEQEDELFKQYVQLLRNRHGWDDLARQVESVMVAWTNIDLADPSTRAMKDRLNELAVIGENAKHRLGWLPPAGNAVMSNLSGASPFTQPEQIRRDDAGLPRMPAENAAYMGRALFTDFLLPVELGGSLLLVATVGAIAIAYRRS